LVRFEIARAFVVVRAFGGTRRIAKVQGRRRARRGGIARDVVLVVGVGVVLSTGTQTLQRRDNARVNPSVLPRRRVEFVVFVVVGLWFVNDFVRQGGCDGVFFFQDRARVVASVAFGAVQDAAAGVVLVVIVIVDVVFFVRKQSLVAEFCDKRRGIAGISLGTVIRDGGLAGIVEILSGVVSNRHANERHQAIRTASR